MTQTTKETVNGLTKNDNKYPVSMPQSAKVENAFHEVILQTFFWPLIAI